MLKVNYFHIESILLIQLIVITAWDNFVERILEGRLSLFSNFNIVYYDLQILFKID